MRLKFLLFSWMILLGLCSAGQTLVTDMENGQPKIYDLPISLTKVQFEIADSIYDYTLFVEPDGSFYFSEGFDHVADSAWNRNRSIRVPIEGKYMRKGTYKLRNYQVSYHWEPNIVRSISRFDPFDNHKGNYLNTYDFDYEWYPFINELFYTSIQDSLGLEPIKEMPYENVIRLTQYEDHVGPRFINFYEIMFNEPSDYKLRYVQCKIDSTNNTLNTADVTLSLGKLSSINLRMAINAAKAENITYFTKTETLKAFLIEIKKGNNYTVLERSAGQETEKKYKSKYSDLILTVEQLPPLLRWKYKNR